jgi:transposase
MASCAPFLPLFYLVRSERLLMEQLDHDILFRWFVGMGMDEPVWA